MKNITEENFYTAIDNIITVEKDNDIINYSNIIVFSDSHKADGFVDGVLFINRYLEKYEIKIKLQFIEDFVSDEGDNAYCVSIVPDDLPEKGE
tara:strand:- start:218 stop:496 length:279 start_codon:yes stop_codon:yes gene_type:complete